MPTTPASSASETALLPSGVPSINPGRKYTSALKELIDTERAIDQARFQEQRYNLKRKAALRMYSMLQGYLPTTTEKTRYEEDMALAKKICLQVLRSAPPVVEEPEIAVLDQFDRVVYSVIADRGQKIQVESEHLVPFLKGFNERAREAAFYNASNAIDGPWTQMHVLLERWGIWRYDMEISEEKSMDDDSTSLSKGARRRALLRGVVVTPTLPALPAPKPPEDDNDDWDDEDEPQNPDPGLVG